MTDSSSVLLSNSHIQERDQECNEEKRGEGREDLLEQKHRELNLWEKAEQQYIDLLEI